MKVAKWGNSLAVRLPRDVIDNLALKEGDEVELLSVGDKCLEVMRDRKRENVLARIKALSSPLPPGFRFDRDDLYDTARNGFRPDRDAE